MKGGGNLPDPYQDLAAVQPQDFASNQEALAIPLVWGEHCLAVRWISAPYNEFTKEAPAEGSGKK